MEDSQCTPDPAVNAANKVIDQDRVKFITAKDTDFSAILAKVAAAKPDVVYLPDYYTIVNLAAKQAKEKGITATFMGGDGWDSPDLDLKAADGAYYTNHYSPEDPRPEVQSFVKAYGEKFKDDKGQSKVPDALATLAYDAANLLLQAIQEANSEDPTKVKDTLATITFNGVSGQITFDANHNPIKAAAILHVKDGKVQFNGVVTP